MTAPTMSPRHVLSGGIRVFLAESLIIPSGLLVAAYLARRLGPDGYGVFAVATALIAWIEWSLTALFSRASVRFVAEAADWRPIGATIVTFHLLMATAAALLLMSVSGVVATSLGTPALAGRLLLSALALRLFDKLDLVALTALGGTPEEVGFYGAAQNLSLLPSIFAASFSPLLLSELTSLSRKPERERHAHRPRRRTMGSAPGSIHRSGGRNPPRRSLPLCSGRRSGRPPRSWRFCSSPRWPCCWFQ